MICPRSPWAPNLPPLFFPLWTWFDHLLVLPELVFLLLLDVQFPGNGPVHPHFTSVLHVCSLW